LHAFRFRGLRGKFAQDAQAPLAKDPLGRFADGREDAADAAVAVDRAIGIGKVRFFAIIVAFDLCVPKTSSVLIL
jgi:hypothetical protein